MAKCTYLLTLAYALTAPAAAASAGCARSVLTEATSRYIAAQSLGEVRYLKGLLPNTTYTENDKATNISAGILSQALKIDHSRSLHDTVACATYTELIVSDPKHPYVIGTQMRLSVEDGGGGGNGTGSWSGSSSWNGTSTGSTGAKILKIQSVVTDAGDWLFNAQHTLHYALAESWDPIPPDRRDSRSTIQAAADAYLDLFRNGNGSVDVPWGDACRRLEGGLYTAPGDTCSTGVPSGVDIVDRRYVIDESVGSVDVFNVFGGGGQGGGLPDSHEFRVEGGRIRFVHTITACWEDNCGFGAPPEILGQDIGF